MAQHSGLCGGVASILPLDSCPQYGQSVQLLILGRLLADCQRLTAALRSAAIGCCRSGELDGCYLPLTTHESSATDRTLCHEVPYCGARTDRRGSDMRQDRPKRRQRRRCLGALAWAPDFQPRGTRETRSCAAGRLRPADPQHARGRQTRRRTETPRADPEEQRRSQLPSNLLDFDLGCGARVLGAGAVVGGHLAFAS